MNDSRIVCKSLIVLTCFQQGPLTLRNFDGEKLGKLKPRVLARSINHHEDYQGTECLQYTLGLCCRQILMVGRQADQLTLKRKSTDNWVRSHPGEGRSEHKEDEGEEVQEEEKGLNRCEMTPEGDFSRECLLDHEMPA